MGIDDEKLSAFLDGELDPEQTQEIEAALARDPALRAALDALMAADDVAKAEFAEMSRQAVPFALAAAIQSAPGPAKLAPVMPVLPARRSGWLVAASVAGALAIGGAAGFFLGQDTARTEFAATNGWLNAIAGYHAVYATQVRHLVEVPAEERDHIETWLSATLGAAVRVPDLSAEGLTFQGARLLVAAGRPVAQLIYLDGEGRVVAVCQIGSDAPLSGFAERRIDAFDMVTWGGTEANFVVVGDEGRADLGAIARAAALQV